MDHVIFSSIIYRAHAAPVFSLTFCSSTNMAFSISTTYMAMYLAGHDSTSILFVPFLNRWRCWLLESFERAKLRGQKMAREFCSTTKRVTTTFQQDGWSPWLKWEWCALSYYRDEYLCSWVWRSSNMLLLGSKNRTMLNSLSVLGLIFVLAPMGSAATRSSATRCGESPVSYVVVIARLVHRYYS